MPARDEGWSKRMKGIKMYKLPVIKCVADRLYHTMTINNTELYIQKLLGK